MPRIALWILVVMLPACARDLDDILDEIDAFPLATETMSSSGTTSAVGSDTEAANGADDGAVQTSTSGSSGHGEGSSTTGATGGGTTGSGTTTSDTTAGEPMCGNGVVEASAAMPEECDDGNLVPDDGCDDTCAADLIVFVTSVDYHPAEIESLYLADALCSSRAGDAGLPDPLRFRAWLSDSSTSARDRLEPGRGRLVLVNGLAVAASWDALLAGELENPIEVTENSETYHGGVWTGTRPDGTAVPNSQHCDDWTSNSITKTGYYGYSDRMTPEWTLSAEWDNPIDCAADFAIYCFAER